LRKITIKIKDEDYIDFQSVANNSGLRIDEKISEIIQYYNNREKQKEIHSISTISYDKG